MTKEEFNALPLEVRRFIDENVGCLGCGGNLEAKLTKAYELYLNLKKMETYKLIGGGINYKSKNESGVLYAVSNEDTPDEIRNKLRIARLVYAVSPELFTIFNEEEMSDLEASLPEPKVVILEGEIPKKNKKK